MGDAVVAAAYVRWWQPSDERHDEVRSMFGFGSSDECEFESHAGGDHSFLTDMGLLAMRLTTGTLLAGHGAQKLFGVFKGPGLKGTGGWLESLGMKPGHYWAVLAGGAEFFGGLTTALGFLNPLGPITLMAPMSVATGKVHWGKPIWVTEGGAELPVTNMAVASGLALAGPGRFSLDRLFGIRLPWYVTLATLLGTAAGIAYTLRVRPQEAGPMAESGSATGTGAASGAETGGAAQGNGQHPLQSHVSAR
ncbi:MAG TPA: DoxX family protein [Dehalococcoidia bacterium]|nr:DoxX family protein [Dehalococcoidia bacterium]